MDRAFLQSQHFSSIQHFGWGVQDLVLVLHWKFCQKHMIYELYSFMYTFIIIADGRFGAFYVGVVVQTQVLSTSVVQNIHPSVEDKRCKTYLNMTVSVRGILSYTTTNYWYVRPGEQYYWYIRWWYYFPTLKKRKKFVYHSRKRYN